MREITIVLTAVFMTTATLWYDYLTLRRKIRPAVAHWFVLNTAMSLAFWTYWNAPEHSLVGNIGNFTGMLSTNLNFFVVLWARWRDNELKYEFTPFQKKSLFFAVSIVALWFVLRYVVGSSYAAIIANLLTQVLMLVGYIMLIQRLQKSVQHSESMVVWASIFAASTFSFFPAFLKGDWLAMLHATRGTVSSAPVVWLIWRKNGSRGNEPSSL